MVSAETIHTSNIQIELAVLKNIFVHMYIIKINETDDRFEREQVGFGGKK